MSEGKKEEQRRKKKPVERTSLFFFSTKLGTCTTWHKMQSVKFCVRFSDEVADGGLGLEKLHSRLLEEDPSTELVFVEDFGQFLIIIILPPCTDFS